MGTPKQTHLVNHGLNNSPNRRERSPNKGTIHGGQRRYNLGLAARSSARWMTVAQIRSTSDLEMGTLRKLGNPPWWIGLVDCFRGLAWRLGFSGLEFRGHLPGLVQEPGIHI